MGKAGGVRPLGRPRFRWYHVKVDRQETGWCGVLGRSGCG
jgi:hypothetical protein